MSCTIEIFCSELISEYALLRNALSFKKKIRSNRRAWVRTYIRTYVRNVRTYVRTYVRITVASHAEPTHEERAAIFFFILLWHADVNSSGPSGQKKQLTTLGPKREAQRYFFTINTQVEHFK